MPRGPISGHESANRSKSFPRVKSDRLKLLKNRSKAKAGTKIKNRTTRFQDKKEKDRDWLFKKKEIQMNIFF